MATAMVAREDKWRGFSVGVDDYMVKPLDEEELLWRVAALLRRSKIASERRLTVGQTTLNYDALSVTTEKGTQILTPEGIFASVFKLLSYPETIFTRRQLMDEIWNMDSDTDERTVDVHINRIREKFGDSPDFEIVTIRGLGYEAVIKR
jgi:DNA-binding response OmpR family regulator